MWWEKNLSLAISIPLDRESKIKTNINVAAVLTCVFGIMEWFSGEQDTWAENINLETISMRVGAIAQEEYRMREEERPRGNTNILGLEEEPGILEKYASSRGTGSVTSWKPREMYFKMNMAMRQMSQRGQKCSYLSVLPSFP